MRIGSGLLSAFVTLLVTIGPVETGAVFLGLTSGVHRPERRNLAVRAVLIAGGLLTVFTLGGVALLRLLHVSLPARARGARFARPPRYLTTAWSVDSNCRVTRLVAGAGTCYGILFPESMARLTAPPGHRPTARFIGIARALW